MHDCRAPVQTQYCCTAAKISRCYHGPAKALRSLHCAQPLTHQTPRTDATSRTVSTRGTVDKPRLNNYPSGVPPPSKYDQYSSIDAAAGGELPEVRPSRRLQQRGQNVTSWRCDGRHRALGAYLHSDGPAAGRPRRLHDAQHDSAIPVPSWRHPARRLAVVNQPALHPRPGTSRGLRRQAIVTWRTLAPRCSRCR